ncbi:MAG TPA: adenylate/guanylate cyclase domain-containing protein, partial [Gaiellaceae bacterium]|nr:adenylate/guanylate cyclase domain-containing protein [Gaiellaceae bacterium]
ALFLAVGLGATGLWLVAYGAGFFDELELDTVDARFTVRGEQDPPANLAVVKIDDVTFDDLNLQWPFPRSRHGEVITKLKADGAKVIAYDVQFSEPSPDAAEDNDFMDATRAAGNVVFATTEVDEQGGPNFLGGKEGIAYARTRVGNGNFDDDPGGVIRRVPYQLDGLKSFSVVAAERSTGRPVAPFSTETHPVDYHGPVGTIPAVSFSDVLGGRFEPGLFRDKIVVVGPWAPSLQDVHPVSYGDELMPGPEIQANAIATILDGLPLQNASDWLDLALIVVLGLLPALTGIRLSLRGTLFLALALALAFVVATQLAFNAGLVIAFVYPFGALVVSSVGSVGAHYLLAAFERERVRDVFARFVPAAVVDDVLKRTDGDLRLGGVTIDATVMFTDLRGFTSVSEALPAAEVIKIVNRYLEEMTQAIQQNGGTLVSYEGDGIMAVFGAPIEQPDHADRAIATAREMLETRLPRFNRWLEERQIASGFYMGIGLNSGDVVSGNVGAENRLEYTAIGDTTNTAARLQGMTKGTPHSVFISDTTVQRLQREVTDLVFVDELEVRGRQAKVKLWSLPVGVKTTA